MTKADPKPWKVRAVNGNAVLASCITKRGADTEAQLSDLAAVVTFEPYMLDAPPTETPGCHPGLTIQARRDRVGAWNEVATLAKKIREARGL
jgi:hypothetical protein